MTLKPDLLLVGCGHLGGAMIRHWLALDSFAHAHIVKPSPLDNTLQKDERLSWSSAASEIPSTYKPDIIIFAVRPRDLETVAPAYAKYEQGLFLSLVAGKKLDQLTRLLSSSHAILRAMPNIASEVGASMTFLTSNTHVTTPQKETGERLLRAIGDVAWLENEKLFDVATALSGCGPGYIFALIESMATAGEKLGLSPDFAMKLARQTVIGSGALLAHTEESAVDLRKAIGNPGTMTEAGLKILLADDALPNTMVRTMSAAIARAQELAQ